MTRIQNNPFKRKSSSHVAAWDDTSVYLRWIGLFRLTRSRISIYLLYETQEDFQ